MGLDMYLDKELYMSETASYNNCNETEGSLLCRWLFNPENFFSAMAEWLRSKI